MKKIMVVEDDRDTEGFLELAISEETPYMALLASNGTEALQISQLNRPDLFLIDYYLPGGMNGIQLYDRLQQIPGLEAIPKIMLSASLNFHEAEMSARGLVGLNKPVDLDELLLLIDTMIS